MIVSDGWSPPSFGSARSERAWLRLESKRSEIRQAMRSFVCVEPAEKAVHREPYRASSSVRCLQLVRGVSNWAISSMRYRSSHTNNSACCQAGLGAPFSRCRFAISIPSAYEVLRDGHGAVAEVCSSCFAVDRAGPFRGDIGEPLRHPRRTTPFRKTIFQMTAPWRLQPPIPT